jgi:hypothetical protein
MIELSQWINGLPVSLAMRRIIWMVPTLQTVHILAIGLVLSAVVMIDLRAWGVARTPTLAMTGQRFLPWLWTALAIATLTGVGLMFAAPRSFRDGAFVTKLYLMGAALVLTVALALVTRAWGHGKDARSPLAGLIGGAALLLWFGATLAGRGRWIAGFLGG